MIEIERLVMLALDELDDAESSAVEEHVLACTRCAATLERLSSIRFALPEIVRAGAVTFPVSPSLGEQLRALGLISRAYHLQPEQSLPCSVSAEDIYAMTTLEANLAGVERVDLLISSPHGPVRMNDIPFDATSGVVTYVTSSSQLRQFSSARVILELFAIDKGGERRLGRYFLDHSAFVSP